MRILKALLLLLCLQNLTRASFAQVIELAQTAAGIKEQVISHTGFTVSYNAEWMQPNWVAWELLREEASGQVRRMDQFTQDPRVKGRSATTYDYSRSGYDRGHMAPAGDMKWDSRAMEESFYLSNICPQHHDINSGQWEKLESRCRGWARFHGRVWICCGPIMQSNPRTIGPSKVPVPSGFFKVVCIERKGRFNAIGFVFPNEPCEGTIWDYALTVDEVEEIMGHDFFFSLPMDIQSEMEGSLNINFWKNN